MSEQTTIEWATSTFNPWIGCTKVSPGCTHCYAERDMDHRRGRVKWGNGNPRSRTSVEYWKQPLRWNRAAAASGQRPRVFCASLADVFDDEVPIAWLADLIALIAATPNLDWLLLTKRPHLVMSRLRDAHEHIERELHGDHWQEREPSSPASHLLNNWTMGGPAADPIPPANVWMGTTVEDQQRANERIPHLLQIPACVRFLSCEPLVGPVDLLTWPGSNVWSGPTITDTWDTFTWPEWVPADIRRHVTEFWSAAYGRNPSAWANSFLNSERNRHTGMPKFGSEVTYSKNWIDRLGAKQIGHGRFVPLWNNIGAVVHADGTYRGGLGFSRGPGWLEQWMDARGDYQHRIHWIICGGESGPQARPMHPHWARNIRDQAESAGVPFLFKQWGEWVHDGDKPYRSDIRVARWVAMDGSTGDRQPQPEGCAWGATIGKKAAGRLLDGRTWDQFPSVATSA